MDIRIIPTRLTGVVIVETDFARDDRGFFFETYHRRRYAEHGIDCEFVQDNHSRSAAGVLRGIHYQAMPAPMAKLVRCSAGRVFDVAVDLRVGSPTFGRWVGTELSVENMRQLFLPVGFGHAFLTLTEGAEFQYKCTNYYTPSAEGAIAWDDPEIGIEWPLDRVEWAAGATRVPTEDVYREFRIPVLSKRDANAMSLREYLRRPAFKYAG